MQRKTIISEFLIVVATIIWGTAFVFQDLAMEYVSPITFNVERCIVGSLFLLIMYYIIKFIQKKTKKNILPKEEYKKKDLIIGSICCGSALALAMIFQQIGITTEGAGKSGFITALYILFVPLIGLFLKRKPTPFIIGGIILAIGGLILINYSDGVFSWGNGSWLLLGCAFFFSVQILFVDHFSKKTNAILLTSGQLFVAFIINLPLMFIFEKPEITSMVACWGPVLFCGVCSSGIAYFLQTFTQKNVQPAIASIIMSLESVFSIIADIIILHSKYGVLEFIGCTLIFISIIFAQITIPNKKPNSR